MSTSRATPDDIIEINVTVENQGDFTESFIVSIFFNEILADSQYVTNLASKDSTILNFEWDTTSMLEGEYTIKAQASIVDDDMEDNTFIDDKVTLAYLSPLIYYIIILVALVSLSTVLLIFVRDILKRA